MVAFVGRKDVSLRLRLLLRWDCLQVGPWEPSVARLRFFLGFSFTPIAVGLRLVENRRCLPARTGVPSPCLIVLWRRSIFLFLFFSFVWLLLLVIFISKIRKKLLKANNEASWIVVIKVSWYKTFHRWSFFGNHNKEWWQSSKMSSCLSV